MASIQKKMAVRVTRMLQQVLALRSECRTPADLAYMARCTELARQFQAAVDDAAVAPAGLQPVVQAVPQPAVPRVPATAPAMAAAQQPAVMRQAAAAGAEDDDDVPPGHPWHGQPDTPPPGWTPPAQQARGHWTSATELQRTDAAHHINGEPGDGTRF